MKLAINDKIVAIQFESKEEETIIKDFFIYNDLSNVFVGGTYNKNRIKKVSFIHKKDGFYLVDSGFLQELIITCKNKISITEIIDKRTKFSHQQKEYTDEHLSQYFPFEYNEHQVRALKKLLKVNTGIIKATTGAGKSEIFLSLIKEINVPTIILFNKVSLVMQTYERAIKNNIKNTGYCYGEGYIPGDVVFSTIGSVYKIKDIKRYKCLIVDEVHRAQANEYQKFLEEQTFPLKFGFSATPEGNKDRYKYALIRRFFGSIIEEIESKELLENKVIAKPIIKFISTECPKTMDYPSAYEHGIVNNEERNKKIKNIIEEQKLPSLILIRLLEHGKILNELIEGSFFINGSHSIEEREIAIQKFKSGEIKTLISSNIFNEGISINNIKVLIIASGGTSFTETTQKIGRSLRLDKDKFEAYVFDFYDYGNKFLEKHSTHRKSIYKKLGFEII